MREMERANFFQVKSGLPSLNNISEAKARNTYLLLYRSGIIDRLKFLIMEMVNIGSVYVCLLWSN